MNNVKNIILVLGTTITLTGCLSGELSDDQKNAQTDNQTEIETPAISNLSEIASRIGDGFPIGAAVSESNITDTNISAIVIQHFNQVTAENIMKPEGLQPNEGDFTFDKADALVDYADDNGMAVHAHTLVWHSQSPAWMKDCTDVADCTDVMNTHITEVVQHFAGENIASWDVVNEAFNDNDGSYRGSNETFGGISWAEKIGEDYINIAYTTARAADTSDSAAKLYYNDYNLGMNDAKLTAALSMIEGLQEDNLIDGIGFQMHVTDTFPTIENITAALKKAADTGLQVKITELDVRMNQNGNETVLTTAIAETQKQRYKAIVGAYLDVVPAAQRGGITVWGISDPDSWIISLYGNIDWPLMFDADLNQKPALQGFADALNAKTDTDSNTNNIVVDFENDTTAYTLVGNPSGSAVVSVDPSDAAKEALKVTIFSDDKGYAAGVAIAVNIPTGKTLADYSAVTFKVYYTAEGEADIANKRIQLLALSGDLPNSVPLIQYNGTWADATEAHLGVMDNAKADTTESTAFQTYIFNLSDGNVEDLDTSVDSSLTEVTKVLTGNINIVFAFPHESSTYYIDDLTLVQ